MSDIHRSRNRIAGRKYTPEEYPQAMKDAIMQRIARGIYSPQDIGDQLGKDRSVITRFTKELANEGKITLTATGRIEKVASVLAKQAYESLDVDQFVQRYPSVKSWVDDMQVRKDGKAIVQWSRNLSLIKVICDTLKITPEMLVASKQIAEDMQKAFILEWRKDHTTGTHGYTMALRNYAMHSGIVWPRNVGGLMSGKKISFGKFAHIKLSDEAWMKAIDAGNEISGDVRDWIAIGVETAARHLAMHTIDINSLEEHGDYLTLRAFESKTQKNWTKYIVNPAVRELLLARIDVRRSMGRTDLFLAEGENPKTYGLTMNANLKLVYERLGLSEPYFYAHATHALRHVGAHHWLGLTNYNYALVARIGGWDDVNTLIKCYGEMPASVVVAELHKVAMEAM